MRAQNGDGGSNPCCTGTIDVGPLRENRIELAVCSTASHAGTGDPVCRAGNRDGLRWLADLGDLDQHEAFWRTFCVHANVEDTRRTNSCSVYPPLNGTRRAFGKVPIQGCPEFVPRRLTGLLVPRRHRPGTVNRART